jgi:glutamyl-Q tRNA(Asp) synthetase
MSTGVAYVGRFAPSPTGPLHLGSLMTAVASFLHARQSAGTWLLRIEDIDPSREAPGATDSILRTLDRFDLHWDGPVIYQHERLPIHEATANHLLREGLAFLCSCSRKDLQDLENTSELGPRYPGYCRNKRRHTKNMAIRVRAEPGNIRFRDLLQGELEVDVAALVGDYLVYRKDRLPAYYLACVLDDYDQRVSHIVRGSDLLLAAAVQQHLARALGQSHSFVYAHLPVLVDARGRKLSKQQGAPAVDDARAASVAFEMLKILGCDVPAELRGARPATLWNWAVQHWDARRLANERTIVIDDGAPRTSRA